MYIFLFHIGPLDSSCLTVKFEMCYSYFEGFVKNMLNKVENKPAFIEQDYWIFSALNYSPFGFIHLAIAIWSNQRSKTLILDAWHILHLVYGILKKIFIF